MAETDFYPLFSYISAITNGLNPTVTFTADHDFTVGEILGFRVGKPFGMFQINNQRARVLSVPSSTQVVVEIDTSTWGTFSLANLNDPGTSPPVCVPSSSGVVPGSQEIPHTNIVDGFDNRPV